MLENRRLQTSAAIYSLTKRGSRVYDEKLSIHSVHAKTQQRNRILLLPLIFFIRHDFQSFEEFFSNDESISCPRGCIDLALAFLFRTAASTSHRVTAKFSGEQLIHNSNGRRLYSVYTRRVGVTTEHDSAVLYLLCTLRELYNGLLDDLNFAR